MIDIPHLTLRQLARGFFCAQTEDRKLAWFDRSPDLVLRRAHVHLGLSPLVPRRPEPPRAA